MDLDNTLDDRNFFNISLNPSLSNAIQLAEQGFAIHWLVPREKRPVESGWSTAPVATVESLHSTYRDGYNLGVRLGEPSQVGGYFVHVLDFDVRAADLADEAWAALTSLFPTVDFDDLPRVQSGSGGASLHLYFLAERPLQSKKLARSEDKFRSEDGKWHNLWEIDLMGTGRQVVLPPSIHPNGKPYLWLNEFDFDDMLLSGGPLLRASAIESLVAAETETYDFESREPLTFTEKQFARTLADIPDELINDYATWITLGQALHHQFGGSLDGFEVWFEQSKRSAKFDDDRRGMLRKWRGFGRNRRKPVTAATLVEWAQDARSAAWADAFDDLDDEPGTGCDQPAAATAGDAFDMDALLGGGGGAGDEPEPATPLSDLDLLGAGGEDGPPGELDWVSLLDLNEEGAIKPTLHNLRLIIENDARISGLMAFNDFTQEVVQRASPGVKAPRRKNPAKPVLQLSGPSWSVRDKVNGDLWSDNKDNAIRAVIEAPKTQGGYSIKITDRDLKAAVDIAARKNSFHPVREYLESTQWDGIPRVETLFIDYLGAEDGVYARGVARVLMLSAVTRIFEPGHKADHVVILEGLQGRRKSTFIKILARSWFAELDSDWQDTKQLVEVMQGAWILQIPELSGFGKADVRAIKAFVSRTTDKVRLAYARRACQFDRQCVYVGSTNDSAYLRDPTGGRRWLPIACSVDKIDTDKLEINIDQLWAEAAHLYNGMRLAQPFGTLPLYLSEEDESAEALKQQEMRREEEPEDVIAAQISAWLERPIATGNLDEDAQSQLRSQFSSLEVWVDCLGNGRDSFSKSRTTQMLLSKSIARLPNWKFRNHYAPKTSRFPGQRIYEQCNNSSRVLCGALKPEASTLEH